MSEYYTVVTKIGFEKLLQSMSQGVEFDAKYLAIGDSNGNYYEPSQNQTGLKNEIYRVELSRKGKNLTENYLFFTGQIVPSVGDFTIREVGLFDSDNNLLAIAKYHETKKIKADESQENSLSIELQIHLSTSAINTIVIDESGSFVTKENFEEELDKIYDKFKNSSSALKPWQMGFALYVDETDGTQRILNGQIVDANLIPDYSLEQLLQIKALYPQLFTTEEDWQAQKLLSDFGQVGKFVLNYASDGETLESIRIPAVINIQGLFDLQKSGLTVQAGLPNVYAAVTRGSGETGFDDAFEGMAEGVTPTSGPVPDGGGNYNNFRGFKIDASKTNPIFGNSSTVQEEAIQYPFFIQIATKSETEVVRNNKIEDNCPYFFGYSLYSSYKLSDIQSENLSLLISLGQENSKSIYPDIYNWILINANEGVEGFVFADDENKTDFDFKINTANETFILPLKNHTADDNKDLYLYYYVGKSAQNANLIDAGRILEQLPNKTDKAEAAAASMPSDKYVNLTLGASGTKYTAPAAGYYFADVTVSADGYIILTTEYNDNAIIRAGNQRSKAGELIVYLPVKKGDIVICSYSGVTATTRFRFVYAQGEV